MVKKIVSILSIVALLCIGVFGYGQAETYVCGVGPNPCIVSDVQGVGLFNTQTTGAANTAVAVTLTAAAGKRVVVHSIEARCGTAADTSGLTVTDGGTTIWSTGAAQVLAAVNFVAKWSPGLTAATNSQVVITLAACTVGTGTLIVQASKD